MIKFLSSSAQIKSSIFPIRCLYLIYHHDLSNVPCVNVNIEFARNYINIFNSKLKSAKIANYSIKRKFSKLTSNRIHPSIQVIIIIETRAPLAAFFIRFHNDWQCEAGHKSVCLSAVCRRFYTVGSLNDLDWIQRCCQRYCGHRLVAQRTVCMPAAHRTTLCPSSFRASSTVPIRATFYNPFSPRYRRCNATKTRHQYLLTITSHPDSKNSLRQERLATSISFSIGYTRSTDGRFHWKYHDERWD